jgi:hypothetical protein
MKKFRKELFLVCVLAVMVSMSVTPVLAATTEYDLWTSPDLSGDPAVIRYETRDDIIGELDYYWAIERVEDTSETYDFYAISVVVFVKPGIMIEGYEYLDFNGNIEHFVVKLDLTSSSKIMDEYPKETSHQYQYGISATVSDSSASLGASVAVSTPDVIFSPDTDPNDRGSVEWTVSMLGGARNSQHRIIMTALIKIGEHLPVSTDVSIETVWGFWRPSYVARYWHITRLVTFSLSYKGNPLPPPEGPPELPEPPIPIP